MGRHKHWTHYVWALLQHFGRECRRTWVAQVIAALLGGFSTAGATFLRTQGKVAFTDVLVDGLVGAAIFSGIYAIGVLFRVPWLEHKNDSHAGTVWQGVGGAGIVLTLLAGIVTACVSVAADLRSEIKISAPADAGRKQSAQLIALEECKTKYAAIMQKEPDNSLR